MVSKENRAEIQRDIRDDKKVLQCGLCIWYTLEKTSQRVGEYERGNELD
jgi:hypothetical protein